MEKITVKSQVTKHFNSAEFACDCCKAISVDKQFIERMERLFDYLDTHLKDGCKAIYINSGYRCAKKSSTLQGAFIGDMHSIGAAADFHAVNKKGENIPATTLCEAAQLVGFGGIAIITAIDAHVDDRQRQDINYSNKQWYGNETNGQNYTTFIGKSPDTAALNRKTTQHRIEIWFDDHKYSGLLEEL